jgi:hypothetical protein
MPKSTAVDAGHGAFTDHTIARYPGRKPNGSSNTWKLKPFGSPEATKIELAKAYLQLYQQTKDERQKKEAMRLVNEVAAK